WRRVVGWFFFSSRRRHTRSYGDWSSDVCSSDLVDVGHAAALEAPAEEAAPESLCPVGVLRRYLVMNDFSSHGVSLPCQRAKGRRSEERRVGKEWRSEW